MAGIAVVAWGVIALIGGFIAVVYLVLGATMTYSLEGVFGEGQAFNWIVLLTAIIGQVLGFTASVAVMVVGIRARRRRDGPVTIMVLGIIATSLFVVIGLVQFPLAALLVQALAL